MVDRVLIGDHPVFGIGFYISLPGINVAVATKFQMAFSTIYEQFQIVSTGSITVADSGSYTATFSWVNLGYRPIIFLSNEKYPLELEYVTTASARLRRAQSSASNGSFWPASDVPSGNVTAYYIVTRSVKP